MPEGYNRHSYHVPGVVDRDVLVVQAEKRRDKDNESTVVHAHAYKYLYDVLPCNEKCMIFEPGFHTHPVNTGRVAVEDEPASRS